MSATARLALATLVLAIGCDDQPRERAPVPTTAAVSEPTPTEAIALEPAADPQARVHGQELIGRHECNRCHRIAELEPPTLELDCVGCHREILAGRFEAPADELAGWQSRIHSLVDVPSLAPGDRFRRAWIASFLADTHDLRPNLEPSMPRLALPRADVEAIAAFLVPEAEAAPPPAGDVTRGRAVIDAKGCGTCHRFDGVPALSAAALPITLTPEALALGQRMAPDLRHVRARMRPAAVAAWLADPAASKPDSAMPRIPMTEAEIADVVAYLLDAPLAPPAPAAAVPERLPVLDRPVGFAEVHARIFKKTCRHCHSDPEQVIGDGGPGYHGGLGFPKRALDLNSYEGVLSGSLDDDGKRRSVLGKLPDGTPRIVAHLMARHAEVAGRPVPGIRGMPLALPPVPLEDIQLLETWIAQGRRDDVATDEAGASDAAPVGLHVVTIERQGGALLEQIANHRAAAHTAGRRVVVELWAGWCAPCKTVDRLLRDEVVRSQLADVTWIKVDTDRHGDALDAAGFDIPTIPAFYRVGADGRPHGEPLPAHGWGKIDAASLVARLDAFAGE